MSEAIPSDPVQPAAQVATAISAPASPAVSAEPSLQKLPRWAWILIALTFASLFISVALWQRLSNIQEALARQSADATAASVEARTLAKSAQEAVKEATTRQALLETRLSEVALQRGQLEELIQSLSRSRDENLVVDVDSALRLAQQQANLTGSLEPLLAALRSAEQRVSRAAQPRLASLQRAILKDIDRVKSANVADTPSLLIKLDELVRLADEMPLANAVAAGSKPASSKPAAMATRSAEPATASGSGIMAGWPEWFKAAVSAVREEARALVRVGRIDTPEAALLTPEQSFFARENLKLKLLNARLALLSRQFDSVRSDLMQSSSLVGRYFDGNSRSVQQSSSLIVQLQSQLKSAEQPRIDDTLAALATLAGSSSSGAVNSAPSAPQKQ
jgi:uroporphyrin-III C-methyltransferase